MMHEHPRGRRFTIETFKLYRRVEHLEPWVSQTNEVITQLGTAGIMNDHLLLGPPMTIAEKPLASGHARRRLLTRSAVDTTGGLGVVEASPDTTPLPRPGEAWTVDQFSVDDDLRFVPFEKCHVMERLVLAQRLVPHMRHLIEVLFLMIRCERVGFHHLNAFMPSTENPETALLTPDWMTVRENLCAAIEQAKIKLKSSED